MNKQTNRSTMIQMCLNFRKKNEKRLSEKENVLTMAFYFSDGIVYIIANNWIKIHLFVEFAHFLRDS